MPGQTHEAGRVVSGVVLPSMEGRARARPNEMSATLEELVARGCLQWRAGHVPGQTLASYLSRQACPWAFNGGPGTCPAKPDPAVDLLPDGASPSMEGRARARPNVWRSRSTPAIDSPLQWRAGHVPGQTPHPGSRRRPRPPFNGGPGTCPAKHEDTVHRLTRGRPPSMEGRARARPNQDAVAGVTPYVQPSMEGRARARPNVHGVRGAACS